MRFFSNDGGRLTTGMARQTIAKHVMNIHMNRQTAEEAVGEIDIDKMKRYVAFCKS